MHLHSWLTARASPSAATHRGLQLPPSRITSCPAASPARHVPPLPCGPLSHVTLPVLDCCCSEPEALRHSRACPPLTLLLLVVLLPLLLHSTAWLRVSTNVAAPDELICSL